MLTRVRDVKVIIASIYYEEILNDLQEIDGIDIAIYQPLVRMPYISNKCLKGLNKRTIDLGEYLRRNEIITCKELTFMSGGSYVLDYAFLKTLAVNYKCKSYLEIGTYIGESINVLTDCCEKLYSVTAPLRGPYSMDLWCKRCNLPDYSERLTYNKKIKHYFTDSKFFDFSQIKDKVDLYFIDGDHSYNGVLNDTINVFKIKEPNAIVVWHDFRLDTYEYNMEVIYAVQDAIGNKFENVFVTNGNLCGVYLPDMYIKDFSFRELKYNDNSKLDTYDIVIKDCKIK